MYLFGRPIEDITPFRRLITSLSLFRARLFYPGDFVVKRRAGEKYLLNYRNYVDRQIDFHHRWEPEQRDYFFGLMRRIGCDLFLDIGANIGYYTVTAALEPKCLKIIAFEPEERNWIQFQANLLINDLLGRVTSLKAAATATAGRVGFEPAPVNFSGSSRVLAGAEQTVEAVVIDELIQPQGQTIFAKIDIEGHELEALKGMETLLARNRVFLQCEILADNNPAVNDWLTARGMRQIKAIKFDYYFCNFEV